MKVVIAHESIAKYDAIGNDIAYMYKIFSRNHECFVYCSFLLNENLNSINKDKLMELIEDKNNLLIYHHSIYWEDGENILKRTKAKIIIKYHNITPENFFKPFNQSYYNICKKGREQTKRLYSTLQYILWISDSKYNELDINGISSENEKMVNPPFHNLETIQNVTPSEPILEKLIEDNAVNLLFVGRIAPNKGLDFLIKILKSYKVMYDNNIILHIIGKKDDTLTVFNRNMELFIKREEVESNIKVVGEVSDSILLSYFLGCDFYINCSEHEGFCVPIIEAQSLSLPVIARKTSAVPDTIGKNQILLTNSPMEYAATIKVLSENSAYKDFLIEQGLRNYKSRFSNEMIEREFVNAVENFTGMRL